MGPAAHSSVQQCVGEEAGRLLEHQGHYCIIPVLIAIHKSNSMDHVIPTRGRFKHYLMLSRSAEEDQQPP